MNRSSVVESLEEEPPKREPWMLWVMAALALSLLLHFAFLIWAFGYPIKIFSKSYFDESVPQVFKVDRVEIDSSLLDDKAAESVEEVQKIVMPTPVELPPEDIRKEKPVQQYTPKLPEQLGIESEPVPKVGLPDMDMTSLTKEIPFSPYDEDALALREALISEQTAPVTRPAVTLLPVGAGSPGVSGSSAVPTGYSDLDQLLEQTGGLSTSQGPIFMPSDVLFAYNEASLGSQALVTLNKLGVLISRNPELKFRIGGHTDSFGGEEYNAKLSLERAESVRNWLISEMGIEAGRLSSRGYGSTRPLAPLTGTIEEQQRNRRVEIEILPANSGP